MRITIELRRPARRSVAILLGLLLLAAPAAVLAEHQFTDVRNLNIFHDDIDWMADYGITAGYNDGTYRPTNAVTREEMAAFMHRLSNEFEVVSSSVDPEAGTSFIHFTPCPDDKRVIAGGGVISSGELFLTASYPDEFGGTGWFVEWESDDNATIDPWNLTVYVTCAPRL